MYIQDTILFKTVLYMYIQPIAVNLFSVPGILIIFSHPAILKLLTGACRAHY